MGILSTYEGLKLTDQIHSAIFYSIGLNEAVFKDYGNEFKLTVDEDTGILSVGTGGGMAGARVIEENQTKDFSVAKGYYYAICLEYNGASPSGNVILLTDPFKKPSITQDNIQKYPKGKYQYVLHSGKRAATGGFEDYQDWRNVIDIGTLGLEIEKLRKETEDYQEKQKPLNLWSGSAGKGQACDGMKEDILKWAVVSILFDHDLECTAPVQEDGTIFGTGFSLTDTAHVSNVVRLNRVNETAVNVNNINSLTHNQNSSHAAISTRKIIKIKGLVRR